MTLEHLQKDEYYYYLYQITNSINNKIYIGVHKTQNLNDGYMGSGSYLKNQFKKYGINNFKKDILEFFETSEEMYSKEAEIVTEDFLKRQDVYNLREGGSGGWYHINEGIHRKNKQKWCKEGAQKSSYLFNTCEKTRNKILEGSQRGLQNSLETAKLKNPTLCLELQNNEIALQNHHFNILKQFFNSSFISVSGFCQKNLKHEFPQKLSETNLFKILKQFPFYEECQNRRKVFQKEKFINCFASCKIKVLEGYVILTF